MTAPLLVRLGARDRALMLRCMIPPAAPRASRTLWALVTHLGSATVSVTAAGVPWMGCCGMPEMPRWALGTLLISHVVVQVVKRRVGRGRPSIGCVLSAAIPEPDRFSFPSGPATASLAVALLHYPSDVLAGQFIALVTAAGVWAAL